MPAACSKTVNNKKRTAEKFGCGESDDAFNSCGRRAKQQSLYKVMECNRKRACKPNAAM